MKCLFAGIRAPASDGCARYERWISALQLAKHRGTPTRALDVIASCPEIEAEILRVLTHKFAWESTRVRAALDTVLARALRVQLRGTVKAAIQTTICSLSAPCVRRLIHSSPGIKTYRFWVFTGELAF